MTTAVTLLTEADCGPCERAKVVLERVANDFPLEVRIIDLATEEGTTLASTIGLIRSPGVLLDGDMFSHGRLSERRLRQELRRRAAIAASARPAQPRVVDGADPEAPEPPLPRAERRAERGRLRAVRRERRRQALARAKDNKNHKKDRKKEKKGKRR